MIPDIYDSEEKAGERIKVQYRYQVGGSYIAYGGAVLQRDSGRERDTEYREAVDSMSLEDKVASIRAKENYTTFDQLPEIYVDAVLSVEDHRFYNHPGIDVIAIGRAVFNDMKAGALWKAEAR